MSPPPASIILPLGLKIRACADSFAQPVKADPSISNITNMARVVIFSSSAESKWGDGVDAKIIEQAFRESHRKKLLTVASIDHIDPISLMAPKPVDIQVHVGAPCRMAVPWAKVNIFLVDADKWQDDAWKWVSYPSSSSSSSILLYRSKKHCPTDTKCTRSVVWRGGHATRHATTLDAVPWSKKDERVLYLVGASKRKAAAARAIVAAWKPDWPVIEICGTTEILSELQQLTTTESKNIVWNTEYLDADMKADKQRRFKYHCCASMRGDGFMHTMLESGQYGALPLWVDFGNSEFLQELGEVGRIVAAATNQVTTESVVLAVERLLQTDADVLEDAAKSWRSVGIARTLQFREGWNVIATELARLIRKIALPALKPILQADLPKVAIITLTHNRPKWFTNMARNVLEVDYPSDRIVWVVVDDGDPMIGRVDFDVLRFREKAPQIRVEYVSLTQKTPIGEKRNLGCRAAPADTEVFVMMDDDDHYPKSSVLARISMMRWMNAACVYCATIPMYDCRRFISAMNVPPLDLGPAQRMSEATLAFTRGFWESRSFDPTCNVAEGEAFLTGRESQSAEIPPPGVIVSFLHAGNSTSRRIPEDQEPNGCHYGFDDEYFLYLTERGERA
jgi:hypothetical protein